MIRCLSCWILVAGCFAAALCRAADERPNIVAIVTDDQGRWAMGGYDNPEIQTPAMDRIAAEGALFTHAFVITPVCSPSRATYLTGLYPTEVGITDYLHPSEAEAGLGLDAQTWPQVLQENGYRTALVGKWHLGMLPQFHPTRLGFDHFMGFTGGGNRPMNPTLEVEGQTQELEGPLPDLLVDDAIRFVRENRAARFALCLHFRAPHLPYGPVPEVDSAPYTDLDPNIPRPPGADLEQLKKWQRDYYGSITSVDRNVGRLLAVLDELDLTENTVVMFTSDHGYNNGRHGVDTKGNAHWIAGGVRGPKRPNMWETSIRVPLAIRWPAVIQRATVIDEVVTTLDTYRTVLGAVGIAPPDSCQARGIDYSPLFAGESIARRPHIFGQYDLHNNGLAYLRMVRTPRYKYVRHFKANMMDELYDLQSDPGEARNLLRGRAAAQRRADVVAPLAAAMQKWQEEIDDPLLESSY